MSDQPSQKNTQNPPEVIETEKLSAIRDIIFGNEIQEYNKEFNEIKDIISNNKDVTDKDLEKLDSTLSARIDKLESTIEEKMSSMQAQITERLDQLSDQKADRRKLGELLEGMAKELKA